MRWLKVDASKWRKNDEIDGRHSSSTSSLKWWSEWTTAGRWGAGVENNVRGNDRTHRSLRSSGFAGLCLLHFSLTSWWQNEGTKRDKGDQNGQRIRGGEREEKKGKWKKQSLLHGLLVLLICTHLLAGLLALLAPLTLLVFVPSMAVTLLAVVPPSTAAAN